VSLTRILPSVPGLKVREYFIMKKLFFFLILLFLPLIAFSADKVRYLVVLEPVADIRSKPFDSQPGYDHDEFQETQVLYNEVLVLKKELPDWFYVEAIEQREFNHENKWQGYPGWIRKTAVFEVETNLDYNAVVKVQKADVWMSPQVNSPRILRVPMGTKFKITGEETYFYKVNIPGGSPGWIDKQLIRLKQEKPAISVRQDIIADAESFLGVPYLWGARSADIGELNDVTAGVDCSGLVSLVYRANNIDIPRDAHEQWMYAKPIDYRNLAPGDLVFVSKENAFDKIAHVMLYKGNDTLIEAPGTNRKVRVCTFKEKFGFDLEFLAKRKFFISSVKIYFGRVPELE